MSSDFTVDRRETWYQPTWNTGNGIYFWVLGQIADLTTDPAVEAAVREHVGNHDKMFFLSWYPDEQAAEIVRVILGPLREAVRSEHQELQASVAELIAMAEGWADATDVFPVFVPGRFVRQESGETVRYRSADPAVEIVFTGVRDGDLPEELLNPEIGAISDGYTVQAVGFGALVTASGLRVLGDVHRGPLEHTIPA